MASRLALSLLLASSAAALDEQRLRGARSSDLERRGGGRHTSFAPYWMGEPTASPTQSVSRDRFRVCGRAAIELRRLYAVMSPTLPRRAAVLSSMSATLRLVAVVASLPFATSLLFATRRPMCLRVHVD